MRFFYFIPILFLSIFSAGQYSISQELKFINHLVDQEEYSDAIYYIDSRFKKEYPLSIRDSLNYFKGWSHYALKELNQSAFSLLSVSSNSDFFMKSRFFASYNYSHLGTIPLAESILFNLKTDKSLEQLKYFELAGNALLKRDLKIFDTYFSRIEQSEQFSFENEKENFSKFKDEIQDYSQKSLLAGGLLSAIIPGAGKIYAGKTGEGIASFLIIASSGITAYENYKKLGIKNAKTILFGSLFAVLYIGNIYGTVFTVKLVNEEFNHEMDHKILFNMHIPLRNFFN